MRNVLISILGTLGVPCILHALIPLFILRRTSGFSIPPVGPLEILSILLAAAALWMVVWVSVTFVTHGKGTAAPPVPPTRFVATGLYRYVRNPMYIGLLLVIIAEALFFRSAWLVLYAFLLWLATHSYVVLVEEPTLEGRFGHPYRQYLAHTPRWIPRLPRQVGA